MNPDSDSVTVDPTSSGCKSSTHLRPVLCFFSFFYNLCQRLKAEIILQPLEYETEHGKALDDFFLSTKGKFQTEIGRRWAAEIFARRNSTVKNKEATLIV